MATQSPCTIVAPIDGLPFRWARWRETISLWVWTGEITQADPALVPSDLAYLSDPNWHMVWGYKAVNGNYMQLKENVCRSGGQAARQAGQYGHTFLTPGANHGAVDVHDPHPEPGGLEHFKLRIIHLTTPVSIAKTHYYWN